MAFATSPSEVAYLPDVEHLTMKKIIVTGPFAVGKTTLIRTLSEIRTLHTEEVMTEAGAAVDDLVGIRDKTTTTVAIDFGRLTLTNDFVLYLYGTPGQERFQTVWDDLAKGALGALVLADTRRLDQSFAAMERVEKRGLPYAVAVNPFPESPEHPDERLRTALDLEPATPLVHCDARDRAQAVAALVALVTHVLSRLPESA